MWCYSRILHTQTRPSCFLQATNTLGLQTMHAKFIPPDEQGEEIKRIGNRINILEKKLLRTITSHKFQNDKLVVVIVMSGIANMLFTVFHFYGNELLGIRRN